MPSSSSESIDRFLPILREALQNLATGLPESALSGMARHYAFMRQANEELNLTAILDPREAAAKHYADSLALLPLMDESGAAGCAIDIGSGAGFPGVPLALARPQWRWVLVESRQKKADFLREAARRFLWDNIEVRAERSEDLAAAAPWRDTFDLATGRAVSSLGAIAELLLPFAKPGALAVAMKSAEEELPDDCADALAKMAGGTPRTIFYDLPFDAGRRSLILFPKTGPTPENFPRRPGRAAKRPLF